MQVTNQHPAPLTTRHGALSIQSSLPVDGGFAINTYAGTTSYRHDILCFTTPDQQAAILAREVIAKGGEAYKRPKQIREDLREALTAELHRMQRRHDTPSRARVEHINALLDLVDPVSDADIARLVESVANTPVRPRTFADLKNAHGDAINRDRAARKAVA